MGNSDINDAMLSLVSILRRENVMLGSAPEEYRQLLTQKEEATAPLQTMVNDAVYLRKKIPEFLNSGSGQFLIRLNDEYIAKFHTYAETTTHKIIGKYGSSVAKNVQILRELFPRLHVADHHYFGINKKNDFALEEGDRCLITPDLTENGRYKLIDATSIVDEGYLVNIGGEAHSDNGRLSNIGGETIIQEITDSQAIKSELDSAMEILRPMTILKDSKYILLANSHVSKGQAIRYNSMDEALLHIFFLQVDEKTYIGRLVAGDLDHIRFWDKH